MKTLPQHTLLYDDECPLCTLYSGAFVATGMLDPEGRKPFCQLAESDAYGVDLARAVNEIALVDRGNGTVLYGVDSILRILGNSLPLIERVGRLRPIHFLLQKAYSFVSFNRKVIVPGAKPKAGTRECVPSFHVGYRLAYMVLAAGVAALLLARFSELLTVGRHGWGIGLLLVAAQVPFQWMWLRGNWRTRLNYTGNLLTVSLMGSLMLLPFQLVALFVGVPALVAVAAFASVATILFFEHRRRVRLLDQPWWVSATWVVYRLLMGLFLV
ncbi:MAG TPA: hypothetical protein VK183_06360 [Flavobacterium sp.]|nr:hypothetical protein [Flavobacterium sp.]